jgi:hypothetical protein
VATLRRLRLAYMTPGSPGRPTDQTEVRWIYTAWLGAFLLKMLGSTWDVSWHFRWLRDDLAPPHLLNSVGTAVVIALVIFHSYSGYGVDRRALRLMQWGIGAFLVAVPLDIVNHRINGLDITSWSPTHGLLYLGTAIMLAGAIRGWWLYAAPGRVRTVILLGLWLLFVENVLFPNQHQEYGVLALAAYRAGHSTAEPSLLDFARSQGQTPTELPRRRLGRTGRDRLSAVGPALRPPGRRGAGRPRGGLVGTGPAGRGPGHGRRLRRRCAPGGRGDAAAELVVGDPCGGAVRPPLGRDRHRRARPPAGRPAGARGGCPGGGCFRSGGPRHRRVRGGSARPNRHMT